MYITQHTDYAFRVLIYAASAQGELVNIGTIAQTFDISKSHLMKVVTALVKGGFLEGVRGKGGGLRLARAAQDIGMGEVMRYMEPLNLVECMGEHNQCLVASCCRLKGMLQGANRAFLAHLDQFTLADVLQPQMVNMLGVNVVKVTKPS